jgi:hypothetical protein
MCRSVIDLPAQESNRHEHCNFCVTSYRLKDGSVRAKQINLKHSVFCTSAALHSLKIIAVSEFAKPHKKAITAE